MTPTELADRLARDIPDRLPERPDREDCRAAAAMLREAERLLANPYLADWVPESWLQETTEWLEGRTP